MSKNKMKKLELDKQIPLDKTCLIEASAGTGKTFSIANIFLQAILSGIDVDKILVVTFTEAATKELRSRIRENLSNALQIIEDKKEDKTISDIFALFANVENKKNLLDEAILNIDQAAIFTMHSFCQRMLTENAFESKIAYGAELITDQTEIITEIVEDYWRENFVNITAEEKELYGNIKFEELLDLGKQIIKFHNVEIVNDKIELEENIDKSKLYETFKQATNWIEKLNDSSFEKEIKGLFTEEKHLKAPFVKNLDATYSQTKSSIMTLTHSTGLKNFSSDAMSGCYKKSGEKLGLETPSHQLFEYCNDLIEALANKEILSKINVIEIYKSLNDYLKVNFKKIKDNRNILTFDDLIIRLYESLKNEGNNGALTRLIRNKFKLALVDEFQDTDNIQYEIFNHLFGGKDNKHGFFMIGDPKQSIYKFRNADIFSYLGAKKNSDEQFTLDTNYRSEKKMVNAINSFFEQKGKEEAFAFPAKEGKEGISFVNVKSGAKKAELIIEDESDYHLNCWLVSGYNSTFIERNIAANIADEIMKLMRLSQNGKAYFDDKNKTSLEMGDFAVLVNSHKQAAMLKKIFSSCKIPAVIQNSAKIFESWESREIELWIKAIIQPTEKNLRPLFITSLFAKNMTEINKISDSELFQLTDDFMQLNKQWKKQGFFVAFSAFMTQFNIREKVLKNRNGERILSNYIHIAELLHKNEMKEGLNIERTLVYLQNQMNESDQDDEYTQRLESDSNAVKIMTIHKSKGLEFPVVFCPFLWNNNISKGEIKQKIFLFNDEEKNEYGKIKYIQKLDFGADDNIKKANRLLARKETLAENIRLAYVALTRARNRCYLSIGNEQATAKSILMYLFSKKSVDEIVELSVGKKNFEIYLNEIFKGFEELTTEENISFTNKPILFNLEKYTPKNKEIDAFLAKEFIKKKSVNWSVGSFSGLTANAEHKFTPVKLGQGAFGLPKGNIFGLAIHEIFENYFTVGKDEFNKNLKRYFERPLNSINYFRVENEVEKQERFNIAKQMIDDVLNANIATAASAIYLKDIEPKDAKAELDFFYKINKIDAQILKNIFADYADIDLKDFSEQLGRLKFSLRTGYMTGQIDMVFRKDNKYFVLDWKTNHLGSNYEGYSPDKLLISMKDSYYVLQYHIYSLAVHLYLKSQLKSYDYDKDFGGAFYIYTRGVDNKGQGVYFDKPKRELIETLEKELI